MGLAAGMGFLGLVTTSSSSSSSSSFMLSAKSGGSFDSVSPTHLSLLLKTLSRSPSSLEQYSKHLIFEVGRTSSSSLLESSAAFLADPSGLISCFAKITTTISTEHNTPSSYAFFNRPFFLLVKVTARFLSCVIGWISIFRRPIGVVDVFVWGDWRGGRRRGRYEVKVGSNVGSAVSTSPCIHRLCFLILLQCSMLFHVNTPLDCNAMGYSGTTLFLSIIKRSPRCGR